MNDSGQGSDCVKGRLLAARPVLQDPNFFQTLVFIAEHDAKGALGFVLNRPLDKTLAEVADGPALSDELRKIPVHYGGPVQRDRLMLVLFEASGAEEGRVQCRLGLPIEQLEAHLQQQNAWVRAFAGYAGWGAGQLDRELRDGAWKICRPERALFADHLVRGLWPFFISGDQRWKKLADHLPRDKEAN